LNRETGTTLVIITHDPEIASMTDRIVTIADGRIKNIKTNEPPRREDLN
jgi:putative ABC transport system ATP-binding protein